MSENVHDNVARYSYRPLQETKNIRLLKLQQGEKGENIVCELYEAEPSSNNAYEALSWCWGQHKWTERIQIRSSHQLYIFHAPPNLVSALKALRGHKSARILWVDLVCINQGDNVEKSFQLPMMNQIYSEAANVCIWLGEADKDSTTAMNFIRRLSNGASEWATLQDHSRTTPKWKALISFLKRPWFTRRWVVQEVALAKQAIMQCGAETLSWSDFGSAMHLVMYTESSRSEAASNFGLSGQFFGPINSLGASRLVGILNDMPTRKKGKIQQPDLIRTLEYLVVNLSVFDTTEPRDKIYALLALAKDAAPRASTLPWISAETATLSSFGEGARKNDHSQKKEPKNTHSTATRPFPVDYNRSLIKVYADFIRHCIGQSEGPAALDIICKPWAPEDSGSRLPSWIIDLSQAAFEQKPNPSNGKYSGRKNADTLVPMPEKWPYYQASGSRAVTLSKVNFKEGAEYSSMFVGGFVIDELEIVRAPASAGNIPWGWLKTGGWKKPSEDEVPEEFWRTLVCDRGLNDQRPSTSYSRDCEDAFKRAVHGKGLPMGVLLKEVWNMQMVAFLKRVQASVLNRRLVRTKGGRLGLVSSSAKRGDLLCIINGCSVPLLLRRFTKTEEEIQVEKRDVKQETEKLTTAAIMVQKTFRKRRGKQYNSTRSSESILEENEGDGTFKRIPWLVEPREVYYKLIGACYVHGVMYGEAVRDDEDMQSHIFELR